MAASNPVTALTKAAKARYDVKPDGRAPAAPGRRLEEARSFKRETADTAVVETRRGWIEFFRNDAPIGHALKDYGEWSGGRGLRGALRARRGAAGR